MMASNSPIDPSSKAVEENLPNPPACMMTFPDFASTSRPCSVCSIITIWWCVNVVRIPSGRRRSSCGSSGCGVFQLKPTMTRLKKDTPPSLYDKLKCMIKEYILEIFFMLQVFRMYKYKALRYSVTMEEQCYTVLKCYAWLESRESENLQLTRTNTQTKGL